MNETHDAMKNFIIHEMPGVNDILSLPVYIGDEMMLAPHDSSFLPLTVEEFTSTVTLTETTSIETTTVMEYYNLQPIYQNNKVTVFSNVPQPLDFSKLFLYGHEQSSCFLSPRSLSPADDEKIVDQTCHELQQSLKQIAVDYWKENETQVMNFDDSNNSFRSSESQSESVANSVSEYSYKSVSTDSEKVNFYQKTIFIY
jgi:hypothetical protein